MEEIFNFFDSEHQSLLMAEFVEADVLQILYGDPEDLVDGGVALGLQGGRVGLQSDQLQPLGQTGRHKVWEAVGDLQRGQGGHDPVSVAGKLDTNRGEILRADPGHRGQVVAGPVEERGVDLQSQPGQPVGQGGGDGDWSGGRAGDKTVLVQVNTSHRYRANLTGGGPARASQPPPSIIVTRSDPTRAEY